MGACAWFRSDRWPGDGRTRVADRAVSFRNRMAGSARNAYIPSPSRRPNVGPKGALAAIYRVPPCDLTNSDKPRGLSEAVQKLFGWQNAGYDTIQGTQRRPFGKKSHLLAHRSSPAAPVTCDIAARRPWPGKAHRQALWTPRSFRCWRSRKDSNPQHPD